MKNYFQQKLLTLALTLALLVSCLVGCGPKGEYTVRFECGVGSAVSSQVVQAGKRISAVEAPAREGYVFTGWYQDAGLTKAFDPQKDKVTADLTLYASWDKLGGGEISVSGNDKDFSGLRTPGSQEEAYDYSTFFQPALDGERQPYVGDPMPYYEDGVYYIYYLKDGGDSYNHSIYLATTTDFVTYTEYDEPILESSRSGGQDSWIGTGSVVKVGQTYYLFYTGHTGSAAMEYKEKLMVAVGTSPTSFEKLAGWEIVPPAELRQKNDFRDPQAYYDAQQDVITLTVTASQDNVARVLKYSLSGNLENVHYDGVIFSNPVGNFWNLECTDTFQIGDIWYLTYSAQDDTLWYATASQPYGPYGVPQRLDGKLFYASKHVDDGESFYMVGWARRSESPSSTQDVAAWAGNLVVQKLIQNEDKTLALAPVDAVADSFSLRRPLAVEETHIYLSAGSRFGYEEAFTCYESFMLTGEFTFTGKGSFGLAFDYSGRANKYKMITLSPSDGTLKLQFNEGSTLIAETAAPLVAGETYSFTYIQEGSVGTFYVDGIAVLTVRLYGASGKTIYLFAENNDVLFTSLRQYTRP